MDGENLALSMEPQMSSANMVNATMLPSQSKGKAPQPEKNYTSSRGVDSGTSDSDSDDDSSASSSDTTSESDSDSDEEIGQEFLDSLLEKARRNAALKAQDREDERGNVPAEGGEEEEIRLDIGNEEARKCVRRRHFPFRPPNIRPARPLPPLDPGKLPDPYIELSDTRQAGPSRVRDLDVEQAEQSTLSRTVPASPPAPPEPTKSGRLLTKKEKKAVCPVLSIRRVKANFSPAETQNRGSGLVRSSRPSGSGPPSTLPRI